MRNASVTIIAAVLLLAAATVSAQDEVVERDLLELSIYGGFAIPSGGVSDWTTGQEVPPITDRAPETGWDAALDFGYYVSPSFIAGITFRYSKFGIDAGEADNHVHRLYNPNLYMKYQFEGESFFVPYVKAHVGLEFPKFSTRVFDDNSGDPKFRELSYDPALAFGGALGLFYYTADFSGIFIEAGYHHALTSDVVGTYQGDDYVFGEDIGVLTINAGVKLIIGSGN